VHCTVRCGEIRAVQPHIFVRFSPERASPARICVSLFSWSRFVPSHSRRELILFSFSFPPVVVVLILPPLFGSNYKLKWGKWAIRNDWSRTEMKSTLARIPRTLRLLQIKIDSHLSRKDRPFGRARLRNIPRSGGHRWPLFCWRVLPRRRAEVILIQCNFLNWHVGVLINMFGLKSARAPESGREINTWAFCAHVQREISAIPGIFPSRREARCGKCWEV
jgi:hypothetical protein